MPGTATFDPKSSPIVVMSATRLPSASAATTCVVPRAPPVDGGGVSRGSPSSNGHGSAVASGRGEAASRAIPDGPQPREGGAGQARERRGDVVGVPGVGDVVDEGVAHRLGEQVEVLRLAGPRRGEAVEDVQRLGPDLVVGGDELDVAEAGRLLEEQLRRVGLEVPGREDAAARGDLGGDRLGHRRRGRSRRDRARRRGAACRPARAGAAAPPARPRCARGAGGPRAAGSRRARAGRGSRRGAPR